MTVELKRRTGETYIYSNTHQMLLNKSENMEEEKMKGRRFGRLLVLELSHLSEISWWQGAYLAQSIRSNMA